RAHAAWVRGLDGRLRAAGVPAVYGCSSLPALSGALALVAAEARPDPPSRGGPPSRARGTLFVGNHNPKGPAAVRAAVGVIGRSLVAPQGPLVGFRGPEMVELPAPFGRRRVYDFDGPEYDLLPPLLGVGSVSIKVGFELRAAGRAFSFAAR